MSTRPERALHTILGHVRIAPRQFVQSLAIWPLVREELAQRRGGARVSTLSQALEDGFVSLDERSEAPGGGPVSRVRIGNRAGDPLLIILSEELHAESGALIAESSVLLPPTSELEISVNPAKGCAEPAGKLAEVDAMLGAFSVVERQIGFIAAIGGEIIGLEVMADADIFTRSFETLLRPYAQGTREACNAGGCIPTLLDPLFDSPESFLAALVSSHAVARPTAGLGRGLRLAGPGLAGCALEVGEIVHLTAFPLEVAWAA